MSEGRAVRAVSPERERRAGPEARFRYLWAPYKRLESFRVNLCGSGFFKPLKSIPESFQISPVLPLDPIGP